LFLMRVTFWLVPRSIYGPHLRSPHEEGFSVPQRVFARPARVVMVWVAVVLLLNVAGLYLLARLGLGLAGIVWVPIVTVTAFDVLKAETGGSTVGTGLYE
jgi:hypothetical protein